jgi:hypothetical protein
LEVEYVFDCPACKNVIDVRRTLPDSKFAVDCDAGCGSQLLDPAAASAIFMNMRDDGSLQSWI